jgi:hypothetical protein
MGAFLLTACTGSFTLTKKVHNFNRDFDEKWVEECVFLAFVIVPVYAVTTLGDALIFNSLEFWTGDNPMASVDRKTPVVAYDRLTDRIVVTAAGNTRTTLTLERGDHELIARDAHGTVVYHIVPADDGAVALYTADGHLVQQLSSEQVSALQSRFAS